MAYPSYGQSYGQPPVGGFSNQADEGQYQQQHGPPQQYGYDDQPPFLSSHQTQYSYDDQYAQHQQQQPMQPYGAQELGGQDQEDAPNTRPDYHGQWVPANQHAEYHQSRPDLRHSESGQSETFGGVNPFDTPHDGNMAMNPLGQPAMMSSNEDIPLLVRNGQMNGGAQPGVGMSGYGQAMAGQPVGYGPGGFTDPMMPGRPHDEDEEESQVRYGRIPQRIPRRLKTIKQVPLYHGNLVLDVQVPKKLLESCPLREDREFSRVRYTAATCDPNDFVDEGYRLRQQLMSPPRQVEMMIVMTMYNEGDDLYTSTMYGVQKNIQHLCSRTRSKTWGADAWKKVVVVVVSDGRKKINSRTLSVLAAQGIYQDGIAKNVVNGKPVTCHIYEYTTQIAVTPDLKYKGAEAGIVPVQVIFALKEQNQKKINSHRWFFNAFAKALNPNVCVLLDVGTRPGPTSIYHLWKAFDTNSNVGGACGEIVTLKGKYGRSLLNPLVAAQNFEYKMSNILDKPLESVFGYITVLPGAFSAYRWPALQNDERGEGPLKEYFKGESLESAVGANLLTKNMYLAEDRVLCWELVSKRNRNWILHYTKSAYGVTDTPDAVPELISQRRRWLNGSFFAAIHATVKFGYLYRSDHSMIRKFWLHVELVYQIFQQIFAWFSLANYYIAFEILTRSLEEPSFGITWTKYLNAVLHYTYLGLLIMCFLLAMGNRPQGSKKMFTFAMVLFAIITVYMTFAAFFIAVKGIQNAKDAVEANGGKFSIGDAFTNSIFRSIILSMMATYGLWLYASIIFFEPWHMFTSFVQYILLAPTYINVINVYAFCNVHDVSWGTKGSTTVSLDLGVVKSSGEGKDKVDVDIPVDEKDIDAAYEDAKHILAQKPPKEVKTVDASQKMEDSYKNIRTNVVLVWAITNGALVAGILGSGAGAGITADGASSRTSVYMAILLYSVAGLAFVKAVGATMYMAFWLFQG